MRVANQALRPAQHIARFLLGGADHAVVRVAQKMTPAPPDYLLDQENQVPRLKQLLPGIFGVYEITSTPNLYRRRPVR